MPPRGLSAVTNVTPLSVQCEGVGKDEFELLTVARVGALGQHSWCRSHYLVATGQSGGNLPEISATAVQGALWPPDRRVQRMTVLNRM